MSEMTADQLMVMFKRFMESQQGSTYMTLPDYTPDDASVARAKAFEKWQDLQHATQHATLLGGPARADALKAWHRLMSEFGALFSELKDHPYVDPQPEIPGSNKAA